MLMISYELSKTDETLQQILVLQYKNLESSISKVELMNEGFVTVHHDQQLLADIGGKYGHMVGKADGVVIAYALVMLKEYSNHVPVLVPMFEKINTLHYRNKAINNTNYLVMGQVCVEKSFRGKGIFYDLYTHMKLHLSQDFDYLITEVATRNLRSVRAHVKVGFKSIHNFQADGEDWDILLWDWKQH
ncbi:GNAT superfamily N-acetyltransferase [Catalinimonas alkaloidigena]|uniref:GNAT family N-acetyltransferase n=1 Tax=Catalinimonas alkaloidigena TaxID=1075417 RepID=UPI00240690D7|nr:GNAT family N-acetyltransferase [Catalinimonas alkaloidigena]MDF9797278.1 GNAT superfamily N-acetyltransferase [Catalinimonas alkaloidigena]